MTKKNDLELWKNMEMMSCPTSGTFYSDNMLFWVKFSISSILSIYGGFFGSWLKLFNS